MYPGAFVSTIHTIQYDVMYNIQCHVPQCFGQFISMVCCVYPPPPGALLGQFISMTCCIYMYPSALLGQFIGRAQVGGEHAAHQQHRRARPHHAAAARGEALLG